MGRKKLTLSEVNDRIIHRGITIIGDYQSTMRKVEFKCRLDHTWMGWPNHILSGSGCPQCAVSPRLLSKDDVNRRLFEEERGITLVGDYVNSRTLTEFVCQCGNIWISKSNNILNGQGCPKCAPYGYNVGRPGWIYVLDFGKFIKYGISNNVNSRLRQHKRNGDYVVVITKFYEDGIIPLNWEKVIKSQYGGKFVAKEIFPNGWTETLESSRLSEVIKTIPE